MARSERLSSPANSNPDGIETRKPAETQTRQSDSLVKLQNKVHKRAQIELRTMPRVLARGRGIEKSWHGCHGMSALALATSSEGLGDGLDGEPDGISAGVHHALINK